MADSESRTSRFEILDSAGGAVRQALGELGGFDLELEQAPAAVRRGVASARSAREEGAVWSSVLF